MRIVPVAAANAGELLAIPTTARWPFDIVIRYENGEVIGLNLLHASTRYASGSQPAWLTRLPGCQPGGVFR